MVHRFVFVALLPACSLGQENVEVSARARGCQQGRDFAPRQAYAVGTTVDLQSHVRCESFGQSPCREPTPATLEVDVVSGEAWELLAGTTLRAERSGVSIVEMRGRGYFGSIELESVAVRAIDVEVDGGQTRDGTVLLTRGTNAILSLSATNVDERIVYGKREVSVDAPDVLEVVERDPCATAGTLRALAPGETTVRVRYGGAATSVPVIVR
ncbi:MAG: hypothetical protein RIT81_00225 [Deltaproteobacteria bacterium]